MGVGIDVAKAELVVGVRPTGTGWTAVNDDHGVRDLVTRMQALGPTLIVLEVTGGDQLLCVAALAAAGAFGARHSHPGVRSVPAAIGCRRATPSGRPPRRGGGRRAGRCAPGGPRGGVGDRAVCSPDTRPSPIEFPILIPIMGAEPLMAGGENSAPVTGRRYTAPRRRANSAACRAPTPSARRLTVRAPHLSPVWQ